MPMHQYGRYEFCEEDKEYYSYLYPHITFQCTRDYLGEVKWSY